MENKEAIPELDPVLMNPKRFLIASILYMLGPRTISSIQKTLKISWGPLYTHIKRMEEENYIKIKKILTPLGPRTIIELTDKGIEAYEELLRRLRKIIEVMKPHIAKELRDLEKHVRSTKA